jgi:hypothetical protein
MKDRELGSVTCWDQEQDDRRGLSKSVQDVRWADRDCMAGNAVPELDRPWGTESFDVHPYCDV